MVACEDELPGIPMRTAGNVSEVLLTARRPTIIASTGPGSLPKMKGRSSASIAVPPRPGRMPTAMPSITPRDRNRKCCGSNSDTSVARKMSGMAWPIESLLSPPRHAAPVLFEYMRPRV
ncbi:hypothetical protein D3C83_28230 [compost metagenome]